MALNWQENDMRIATRAWLSKEQQAQFARGQFNTANKAHAHNRVREIAGPELPRIWKEFQYFRRIRSAEIEKRSLAELRLKVAQKLLFACALSQEAYTWQGVYEGKDAYLTMRNSFREIDHYLDELKAKEAVLPETRRLNESLPSAVDATTGTPRSYEQLVPRMRGIVGLAIVGLVEQWPDDRLLILPEPGHLPNDALVAMEFSVPRTAKYTDR